MTDRFDDTQVESERPPQCDTDDECAGYVCADDGSADDVSFMMSVSFDVRGTELTL